MMKTISDRTNVKVAFKRTQVLPLLTGDLVIGRGGVAVYPQPAVWPDARKHRSVGATPVRRAASPSQNRVSSIWLPAQSESGGERIAFGLLVVAAGASIAQALGTMITLAPNWDLFTASVARLLA